MANFIKDMSIRVIRLTPTEAELHICIYPETISTTTKARGRFVGPRCTLASTIEIAYPLREMARISDPEQPQITLRVIVPEPCLWDQESPFFYRCLVELCEGDQLCGQKEMDYGLAAPPRRNSGDEINSSRA